MLPELNTPIGFAGKDGFYWWVGQVESKNDPKNSNRYKVRIVGQHVMSCDAIPVEDLPWAVVMLPVTAPSREGNSNFTASKLDKGDWVIGFFLDGSRGQNPVIMGSFQKVSNSVTNNTFSPNSYGESCLGFKRAFVDTNPHVAMPSDGNRTDIPKPLEDPSFKPQSNPQTSAAGSPVVEGSGGTNNGTNPAGRFSCVGIADAGCKDTKKTDNDFKRVLTEFFGNVSNSGGQVGTQMLSGVTGTLYDYTNAANGYVSRIFGIAKAYIGAAKAKLFALIKQGISSILSFSLGIPTPDKTTGANQPQSSSKSGVLGKVTTFLQKTLDDVNCQIADLEGSIYNFLLNLIFSLLEEVISAATCVIEATISKILSELEKFLNDSISAILGVLQAVLGIIASPLNILSAALKYIFDIFGIKCSGVDGNCREDEQNEYCTGKQKKKPGEDDFAALDQLIADISADGVEPLQTSCTQATANPCPEETTASVVGGTPLTPAAGPTVNLPSVLITANPTSVAYNGSTTITWTSTNATTVTSSNFNATTVSGTQTFNNLTTNQTYEITVEGPDGSASGNVVVYVGIAPPPAPPAPLPVAATPPPPVSVNSINTANIFVNGSTTFSTTIGTIDTFNIISTANLVLSASPSLTYSFVPTTATNIILGNTPPTYTQLLYSLTANKSVVQTNDSITFSFEITSGSVPNGSVYDYLLFGSVQLSDFVGNAVTGSMVVNNNIATVTIQTSPTFSFYGSTSMSFIVLKSGSSLASYNFTLVNPVTTPPPTNPNSPNYKPPFSPPKLCNIEVDATGKIMSIDVCDKGTPYSRKPFIKIYGEGIGASATPVLDENGFIVKIKVQRPGTGYVPNRVNKNCIIDDFVIIRPGLGYTSPPTIYVNGEKDIARAIISDRGYISAIEVINKTKTYENFPTIQIIGGGGAGAKAIPSFGCLDDPTYTEYINQVAPSGTDSVIDCP